MINDLKTQGEWKIKTTMEIAIVKSLYLKVEKFRKNEGDQKC